MHDFLRILIFFKLFDTAKIAVDFYDASMCFWIWTVYWLRSQKMKKKWMIIFKITPSTVKKVWLHGRRKGVQIRAKELIKSICYNFFSKNVLILYFSILIDLSSESESNSVLKLIVERQANLLVLKHMAHPVFLPTYNAKKNQRKMQLCDGLFFIFLPSDTCHWDKNQTMED